MTSRNELEDYSRVNGFHATTTTAGVNLNSAFNTFDLNSFQTHSMMVTAKTQPDQFVYYKYPVESEYDSSQPVKSVKSKKSKHHQNRQKNGSIATEGLFLFSREILLPATKTRASDSYRVCDIYFGREKELRHFDFLSSYPSLFFYKI